MPMLRASSRSFVCWKGFGVSRKLLITVLGATLLVAACSSEGGGADATSGTIEEGDGATSTSAVVATTEAPPSTEEPDDGGETVGLGDIPQECLDAFVVYLQAIEPVVEEVDWANATMADLEALGTSLEPATEEFEAATVDSQCDEIDVDATDEESFEFMIDLARDNAPGTVAYMEMIRDFASDFGESTIDISGDCDTDIAALQAIVDEGGSMQDMTVTEITDVGGLVTSISTNCSPERSSEFFSKQDVSDFMSG